MLVRAILPDAAQRIWTHVRAEAVSFDVQRQLVLKGTRAGAATSQSPRRLAQNCNERSGYSRGKLLGLGPSGYPEALVAGALNNRSGPDFVRNPACGQGRRRLRIDRLQPNRRYSIGGVVGTSLAVAGRLPLDVVLARRTPIPIAAG